MFTHLVSLWICLQPQHYENKFVHFGRMNGLDNCLSFQNRTVLFVFFLPVNEYAGVCLTEE